MADRPASRLLLTVFALAAFSVFWWLPYPGLDPGSQLFGHATLGQPMLDFVWAYLWVEAAACAVPRWRGLRGETSGNRSALFRATIAVALAFAAIRMLGVAAFLQNLDADTGGILASPIWSFRLILFASFVGVAAVTSILGMTIDRRGLGSGFGALFVMSWAIQYPLRTTVEQALLAGHLVELALGAAAIAAIFLWLRRMPQQTQPEGARGAVPLPTAGILPFLVPSGAWLTGTLASLLPLDIQTAAPVARLVRVLLAGALLSAWLQKTNILSRAYGVEGSQVQRTRRIGGALSLAWLAGVVLLQDFALRMQVQFGLELLWILVAVAYLDDVVVEWRFRRHHGRLVPIHELGRLWLGGLVHSTCAERDIPVLLRGASFRSLFQGLGPIFEVTVLVPEAHAGEARALVRSRLAAALGEPPPEVAAKPAIGSISSPEAEAAGSA